MFVFELVVHNEGETPSADSAVGLVCFQFVQGRMFESGRVLVSSTVLCSGYASHYARILHLSVASPEAGGCTIPGNVFFLYLFVCQVGLLLQALRSAVLNSKRLIFGTLPVQSPSLNSHSHTDTIYCMCFCPHVFAFISHSHSVLSNSFQSTPRVFDILLLCFVGVIFF